MSARRRRRSNSNSKDEAPSTYSDYSLLASGPSPSASSSPGEMGCRDRTQEFRSITMSLRSNQVVISILQITNNVLNMCKKYFYMSKHTLLNFWRSCSEFCAVKFVGLLVCCCCMLTWAVVWSSVHAWLWHTRLCQAHSHKCGILYQYFGIFKWATCCLKHSLTWNYTTGQVDASGEILLIFDFEFVNR